MHTCSIYIHIIACSKLPLLVEEKLIFCCDLKVEIPIAEVPLNNYIYIKKNLFRRFFDSVDPNATRILR